MKNTFNADEVKIGYHPDGYRIDTTTSAINRYTKWEIHSDGKWSNMIPVCFDSMPDTGWIKANKFDWENIE
jgi:hypothetical protein